MIRASFPGMSLWNDLERFWRNIVGDSDYEDDEIDPEDAYVVPEFAKWDKTRNVRQLFSERVGPTRVLDGSNRPVDYFKLFCSDYVFAEITRFTNLNAATKRACGDKGVWTDVTVDEIKAFFGILIIMDTMKFDCDELYWSLAVRFQEVIIWKVCLITKLSF